MATDNVFITADVLTDRLVNADHRKADSEAMDGKPDARPFLVWDKWGDLTSMPARLIVDYKTYDDNAQLIRWINAAKNLGGKPSSSFSPYARFALKPSETLKSKITLYFTPSEKPLFRIDVPRLEGIIKANPKSFDEWAKWKVIEYTEAEKRGLKCIGRHFLQLYFTWMEVGHYKQLWKEFEVSQLLHTFPAAGDMKIYEEVDSKTLNRRKGKLPVDGRPITITSQKIRAARGTRKQAGRTTQSIMGESATTVGYL